MYSATRFVVAGVILTLFGGLLLAGVLSTQPSEERMPAVGASATAAVGTGEPASSTEPSPSASPQATHEVYEATARLMVDPGPDPSVQDLALAEAALVRYADLATSRPVARAVIEDLGLDDTPEDLLERISAEASTDTLALSIAARDDAPEAARRQALAVGNALVQHVRDDLITDDVKAADAAITTNEQNIKTLQNRLNRLQKTQKKTPADRAAITTLIGQVSLLQRNTQDLRPSSRAYVRNLLEWYERPTVPAQPVQDEGSEVVEGQQGMVLPTRDVVVATRRIERGTALEPEMLTLRTVPLDATNDMALTDPASVLGKVAAIDILKHQAISPNMLVAE